MWLYDFSIFYQSGKAILSGMSPYQIYDFNSPIFMALFFVPFSILPIGLSYSIYIFINIFFAWRLLKKKIIYAFLFFPFLFSLFVGQIDFLLAGIILMGSPWLIGLSLIKPQVAFVIVPWMLMNYHKHDWLKAGFSVLLFIVISFMVQPNWVSEWFSVKPEFEFFSTHASNFYWIVPLNLIQIRAKLTMVLPFIILPLGFLFLDRKLSWTFVHLFAPLTNIYSPSILLEWIGPVECLLSWLAVLLVQGNIHSGMPLFLIGLSIILREYLKLKKDNKFTRANILRFSEISSKT